MLCADAAEPAVLAGDVDSLVERIKHLATQGEAHSLVKKVLRAYYQKVWTGICNEDNFAGRLWINIEMETDHAFVTAMPKPIDIAVVWSATQTKLKDISFDIPYGATDSDLE